MQQPLVLSDVDQKSLRRLIFQTPFNATTLFAREDSSEKTYAYQLKIDLSKDGQDIQDYVNQPLYLRKHVSYEKSFLKNYLPNQTYYLPASAREQLHYLGCTSLWRCE